MNQLNGQAPDNEGEGSEGIKSSRDNFTPDHRQDLNKSYNRCTNDLLEEFIAKGYDKLLQLNPAQIYKEQVAYAIKQSNPFKLPLTDELVFKSILAAHTKTKRVIENLYLAKAEKVGDL